MDKIKKKYEPPMVKEIGGVFEQALGLTCTTGGRFSSGMCTRGMTPSSGGCSRGNFDFEACIWGAGDTNRCSRGTRVGR